MLQLVEDEHETQLLPQAWQEVVVTFVLEFVDVLIKKLALHAEQLESEVHDLHPVEQGEHLPY